MEEGFNYPVGSPLAVNPPWSGGAGSALAIVSGNLAWGTYRGATPEGNLLQIGLGTGGDAVCNFTTNPVTQGAVFCSALINVATPPGRRSFAASLLPSGSTVASPPDDPLDFDLRGVSGGFSFSISHSGSDPATAGIVLATNTTHLIVLKYAFGSGGRASLYIDPMPGAPEPSAPDAVTESSDDDNGGDPTNLQVLLLSASGTTNQGAYSLDTVRIGTNWADVTPGAVPITVTGPLDQGICSGSAAVFSVTATGTPPIGYQWRTNGIPIPDATNNSYTLANPGASDALNAYDVVVTDTYGTTTSTVATLSISQVAPAIVVLPANQIVWPGTTSVTYSVTVSGDAPLSYQWRTNGVPVANATNASYTLTNPAPAEALIAFDVMVSNPCGAATSSPPASLSFAHVFFSSEGLPGFFSGMNLISTNVSGLSLSAWSSADPAAPISGWALEGPLAEQPLNDGTGRSIYSINVNPLEPLVYYVIGTAVSGPYVSPAPVQWITTDTSGNSVLAAGSYAITAAGVFILPGTPPPMTVQSTANGIQLDALAVPGAIILLQAAVDLQPPVDWVTIATNAADTNGSMSFSDTNTTAYSRRFYRLVSP